MAEETEVETQKVTCKSCGKHSTIMVPADPEVEVTWQCPNPDCKYPNYIEGHAGEPGEAAFNPAATAISDEDLAEAAARRLGMIHNIELEGNSAPAGVGEGTKV